jgi:enoyl-[acyl-carrier-protein] reductase (NADH)
MIAEAAAEGRQQGYNEIELAQAACRKLQQVYASHCAIEEVVTAQDVADCALFLGSDLSRKITGQVIHVDCGLSSSHIF